MKVAAHAIERGIEQDSELTHGNERADHHAGRGAETPCLGDQQANLNSWIDATTTIIQKRLLAIVTEFGIKHSKDDGLVVVRTNAIDSKIAECGHEVVAQGKYQTCIKCAQTWQRGKWSLVLNQGQCLVPHIWGDMQVMNPDIPRKNPQRSHMIWAKM